MGRSLHVIKTISITFADTQRHLFFSVMKEGLIIPCFCAGSFGPYQSNGLRRPGREHGKAGISCLLLGLVRTGSWAGPFKLCLFRLDHH